MTSPGVSVMRRHGLGNVLQLLPVLRTLHATGVRVELVTRPEWIGALGRLAPELSYGMSASRRTLDLDALTATSREAVNRTALFMDVLGVYELRAPRPVVPDEWLAKWNHVSGALVLALEAAFPARRCPPGLATGIGAALRDRFVALVGQEREPAIECTADLRGQTLLEDLVAIVARARCVVCMDSSVLHLATTLEVPAVALFGGISPESRLQEHQRVTVLVGDVPCRPCNKNETCNGAYDCLHRIRAADVVTAVDASTSRTARSIVVI
jgi:ADP-heptose:LPS heptosyltransferase